MKINKSLNTIIWVLLFIFLLPSSLAVASWNSLPGSMLYGTKLFMEQGLAYVVPSASAKGNLQIAYTERRFSEADRMLSDRVSVEGLPYLNSQIDVTKNQILASKDPVVKHQLAQKYIVVLQDMDTKLEAQKQILTSAPNPTSSFRPEPTINQRTTITRTPTPTLAPNPTSSFRPEPTIMQRTAITPGPTPAPEPTSTPPQPGDDIGDTQKKIHDTIHDIEEESKAPENMDRNNQGNNDKHGNNGGNNQ